MSKIRRQRDKEILASMLDEYGTEKCLRPRNCNLCTFSIDNNSRCALNLVCNSIERDLSSYNDKSNEQRKHVLYDNHNTSDNEKENGNNDPTITNGELIDFLYDFLPEKDWCLLDSGIRLNAKSVHAILYKYSKKYRKEFILWKKRKEKKK